MCKISKKKAGFVWQNVNQPYVVDCIAHREFYINS